MAGFIFGDGAGTPNQYTYTNSSVVTVYHSLGYHPQVWIMDSNNKQIYGDITWNNLSTFTVTFATTESGVIYYR